MIDINLKARPSKMDYYLDIAETVSERSTCLRIHYGAIIVKDDIVISTGYNGAPRGVLNCIDDENGCLREQLKIPHGERYEMCKAIHAENNAIIAASRKDMIGSSLYLVGKYPNGEYVVNAMPCRMCKRLIINAGITNIYIRDDKNSMRFYNVSKFIDDENNFDVNKFLNEKNST